jgi:hypothetical protein
MNEQQVRWTIAIVVVIGGLFGFYSSIMIGYFMDALPHQIAPLFLISQLSPYYLVALVALQLTWFVRWQSLETF